MNVNLITWHESDTCTWCERTKECVTADFGDEFISKASLCWRCLQKAVKVRSRKDPSDSPQGKPFESPQGKSGATSSSGHVRAGQG